MGPRINLELVSTAKALAIDGIRRALPVDDAALQREVDEIFAPILDLFDLIPVQVHHPDELEITGHLSPEAVRTLGWHQSLADASTRADRAVFITSGPVAGGQGAAAVVTSIPPTPEATEAIVVHKRLEPGGAIERHLHFSTGQYNPLNITQEPWIWTTDAL
jgi:hypothetical protein